MSSRIGIVRLARYTISPSIYLNRPPLSQSIVLGRSLPPIVASRPEFSQKARFSTNQNDDNEDNHSKNGNKPEGKPGGNNGSSSESNDNGKKKHRAKPAGKTEEHEGESAKQESEPSKGESGLVVAEKKSQLPVAIRYAGTTTPTYSFPTSAPIIHIHGRPLFPGVSTLLSIRDSTCANELARRTNEGNPYIGLFVPKSKEENAEAEEPIPPGPARNENVKGPVNPNTLCQTGVLGRIERIRLVEGGANISLLTLARIRLTGAIPELKDELKSGGKGTGIYEYKVVPAFEKDLEKGDNEVAATMLEMISTVKEIVTYNPFFKEQFQAVLDIADFQNPIDLVNQCASLTTADAKALQEILDSDSVVDRLKKTLLLLKRELDVVKVQRKINKHFQEQIDMNQRRHFLMEQMKAIKKELGIETDAKDALMSKFQERLRGLPDLPEHADKVIKEEMTKLSMLEPQSSEFNSTRSYLEWLTCLPWNKFSNDRLDLDHAKKILDEDHYGLKDIKERIMEFVAVGKLKGNLNGKILCLVGPPGVGKTSIGRSIARAVDRKFYRFSVGGMTDVAEIKGHRRTYVGAMPGKLLQCMKLVQTANPVILIDEIDKLGKSYQGDPASALLEVLDPEQNTAFLDHYLDTPFDLSKVLFICTANVIDTIPGPLLDRMEVLRLSGYIADEKMSIASKYLIPVARKETGVKSTMGTIKKTAISKLIEEYCREAGVRSLQKHVEKILRKIALKVATGTTDKIVIDGKTLPEFVGRPKFTNEKLIGTSFPGVANGLAWTALGGATLYIETALADNTTAGLITTGQMGDVMKESTKIAYSFSKAYILKKNPGNRFFDSSSLHMHIPEGATPKDGPSAGITMVTSLLSLALGKSIKPYLAMTGELTLTGSVLAIGGVKEKTLAARRAGVKEIIFPEANRHDWNDLEENVKEGFIVHFAKNYDDVFRIALDYPHAEEITKKIKKKPVPSNEPSKPNIQPTSNVEPTIMEKKHDTEEELDEEC